MSVLAFLAGLVLFIFIIINFFKRKPIKKLAIGWAVCSILFIGLIMNDTDTVTLEEQTKETVEETVEVEEETAESLPIIEAETEIPVDKVKPAETETVEAVETVKEEPVEEKPTRYEEDNYKVGSDIPAGEYVLYSNSAVSSYFSVNSDSNGNDILFNGLFKNNSIVTIKDGEYFELDRAYAVPFEDVKEIDVTSDSFTVKVGEHIEAGEYKLTASGSIDGYYVIYNDSRNSDIISNELFGKSTYVTVKDGEYLSVERAYLNK